MDDGPIISGLLLWLALIVPPTQPSGWNVNLFKSNPALSYVQLYISIIVSNNKFCNSYATKKDFGLIVIFIGFVAAGGKLMAHG